jgi:hypothetical protein
MRASERNRTSARGFEARCSSPLSYEGVIADDPDMDRVGKWYSERPRRASAEYAVELARMRAWRDVERSFVTSVPDLWDLHGFLELDLELSHALVFALNRQPATHRRELADRFYERRTGHWPSPPDATVRAASVALMMLPLTLRPDLESARIADLLTAIQQGDDLGLTPPQAIADVQRAVARARLDLDLEDQLEPTSAATTVVVETLDPSGDEPPFQALLMRATWAMLETSGVDGVLDFLLAVDALNATRDDV